MIPSFSFLYQEKNLSSFGLEVAAVVVVETVATTTAQKSVVMMLPLLRQG